MHIRTQSTFTSVCHLFITAMSLNIAVGLYHRDQYSLPEKRHIYGYEAYHWSILITPPISQGQDCQEYDATDSSEVDPITLRLNNPTMDWWFRAKPDVDPQSNIKMLGRVVIGQAPAEVSRSDLGDLFQQVPLPIKNQDPQQSCVTWVTNAIISLQEKKWVQTREAIDVEEFKRWALAYANKRHDDPGSSKDVEEYR